MWCLRLPGRPGGWVTVGMGGREITGGEVGRCGDRGGLSRNERDAPVLPRGA